MFMLQGPHTTARAEASVIYHFNCSHSQLCSFFPINGLSTRFRICREVARSRESVVLIS